ncbi:MAG TPA: fumarylacetoacetate hydrolase family protein [Terriglobales bacterium]|jgi:2-keto-4-pentenoate hydratase/2-oxohepta-3-ene-1,7-dioic acid hydratase in catechol pathway|nr:fumarylacetoacetate hydrolase family protein [Terriglobales bacterium]
MRLVSFHANGSHGAGILEQGGVFPLAKAGFDDALSFIAAGAKGQQRAESLVKAASARELLPVDSVRLSAPIPRPPKILCVGLNYRDHAKESNMEVPAVPTVFAKYASSVIGPGEPIVLSAATQKPDYEAEFAVVIGRRTKQVQRSQWKDYVFGYTILNDVSARDVQLATSQWTLGKSFDTFAPMGPHIVTADEILDPHALDIRLSIGGETLQHSNTRELIFGIPELIEYLSRMMTLEPGDIISTGTPAGVGLGRTPPRWLRPGEEILIEIEKIGILRNPVIAEQAGK